MNAKLMLNLVLCFFVVIATWGFSQTLVKDINSDTASTFASDDEVEFVYMGTYIYFAADDGVHGQELWRTQGTAATTTRVKNINMMFKTGGGTYGSNPHHLVVFKNTLYFFANDGLAGECLWKSNGTDAGTVIAAEIDPYQESKVLFTKPRVQRVRGSRAEGWIGMQNVNNTNLILGYEYADGSQSIWWSDGTTNGTRYIDTFVDISHVTSIKNIVYFGATDARGWNLWRTDGKITQIVYSITTTDLIPIGDTLFFVGHTGDGDFELWRTDGTYDTTYRVKNINSPGASNPTELTVVGNTLYFIANEGPGNKLWRSNGTADNTVVVENTIANPIELEGMGTNLYFATANSLYKTDGTWQGTILLKADIAPKYLTTVGTTLYFSANVDTTTYGRELWKTTGTPATTAWVGKEILVGNNTDIPNGPCHLMNCNGVLYFTGYDATTMTRAGKIGREVWKSQGAATTTLMVADINVHSTNAFIIPTELYQFAAVGTNAYFIASDDGVNNDLWKTNATTAGTIKVTTAHPAIHGLWSTSTTLFIFLNNGGNRELWKLNEALPAKMEQIKDGASNVIHIAVDGDGKPIVMAVGSNLYFQRANDSNNVWVTGGTTATTLQVTDPTKAAIVGLGSGRVVNGVFYFSDNVAGDPLHLYKISGGVNKAVEITDTNGGAVAGARKLVSFKSTLYFIKWVDLWRVRVDGKAEEFYNPTTTVRDLGIRGSYLYLVQSDAAPYELWQTDGTLANTKRVQDANGKFFTLPWDEILEYPGSTTTLLYFVDGTTIANTLWQTNGTAAGTVPVKDATGRVFSGLLDGTEVGAKLYFIYDDGIHGLELWETSGTPATTLICKEITPFGSAYFDFYFPLLGKLFMVADNGISGLELWIK